MGDSGIDALRASFSSEAIALAEHAAGLTAHAPTGEVRFESGINGAVYVGGRPMQFAFVEHNGAVYQTDAAGRVWIPGSGSARAKVWAANDAVRVINGEKFNIAYTQDVTIPAAGTVNVFDENGAFSLAQRFHEVLADYRTHLPRWSTLGFQFAAPRRIEVSYPDKSPATLAFVEPTSMSTRYPLVHVKGPGQPDDETLWHEYAHALHFALVPEPVRAALQSSYLGYLLTHLHDPYHDWTKRTDPTVAWVEALGDFCGGDHTGRFRPSGALFTPPDDGRLYEGAIATLLFVDLPAARVPFDAVVASYVDSQARSFAEYAEWTRARWTAVHALLMKLAPARNIVV